MDQMMHMDVQLVFLGVGEEKYHTMLRDMARQYREKLTVFFEFDEAKAHAIYAGSDLFLMPSHFEPCGMGQIISLKYGTVPLVFKTGGLADTIVAYDAPGGNGFVFTDYTREALMETFKAAVTVFSDAKLFRELQIKAMGCDFSWEKSALEYQELYRQCLVKA
jgi:starch synthase